MTFLLLLVWFGWAAYMMQHRWMDVLGVVGFIVSLFSIVVLHEFGHAMTARRFGIKTRDITLLPIGGVARLERMPTEPRQELAVAIAGPAVNVLLAILLFAILSMTRQVAGPEGWFRWTGNFLSQFMWINLFLAVFNLLPAFPMDGGRVLRALLATRLTYVRATSIAARIGQVMAVAFALYGLFGNPFLILIAVFVWIGAAQEASLVQMKSALGGVPVREVMITDFRTLEPEDTLSRAVQLLLGGYQHRFPVISQGKVVGVLTRGALMNGLARLGQNMPVADVMEKQFPTADADEPAENLFMRLQDCRSMPVLRGGEIVGVVTSENLAEFLMVQDALQDERNGAEANTKLAERHAT